MAQSAVALVLLHTNGLWMLRAWRRRCREQGFVALDGALAGSATLLAPIAGPVGPDLGHLDLCR